jgi:hypothetical protein
VHVCFASSLWCYCMQISQDDSQEACLLICPSHMREAHAWLLLFQSCKPDYSATATAEHRKSVSPFLQMTTAHNVTVHFALHCNDRAASSSRSMVTTQVHYD